ncbi:hypothetical protein HDV05_000533 [Chytridiales sp. JEL 0842]|nr:hypothetical protein HDV05_000533 [Chytridiales sp. JEL 0842]
MAEGKKGLNLSDILDGKQVEDMEDVDRDLYNNNDDDDGQQQAMDLTASYDAAMLAGQSHGFCSECEDQPAVLSCDQCHDDYCQVCFHSQHRKGTRKRHTVKKLIVPADPVNAPLPSNTAKSTSDSKPSQVTEGESLNTEQLLADEDLTLDVKDKVQWNLTGTEAATKVASEAKAGDWFLERAKYIPLRLTLEERKYLRLLEAALNVSEYTDKVDILTYTSKSKRQVAQIRELCQIISGLVLAADYKVGQALFRDKNFEDNEEFFQNIFELGRRHKIMNPEKMRNIYGKLVYILQDSQIPEVKEMLQFSCVGEIKTVYRLLEQGNGLKVLQDDLIVYATKEIIAEGRTRAEIQKDIKMKEKAIEMLARKYATHELKAEEIKQCLYSIGDNHAFLRTNRDPCDKMIAYLKKYFNPDKAEPGFSLAIHMGREGARLSHDHNKQYNYVIQSLTLWREVLHDMFMLWTLAENDLFNDTNPYRLRDTGQGLNRVQAAPKTSRMMHTILHRAQQRVGYWVGSSVIHMGDHNVPNALMFIDKYSQIFRILLPIVTCLDALDSGLITNDPAMKEYVDKVHGSVEGAKKTILADFFRHGFDGSGALNFFDAGSCVDGRITSCWQWCSQIEKKSYFPLFLLSGFMGFDGEWSNS